MSVMLSCIYKDQFSIQGVPSNVLMNDFSELILNLKDERAKF